MDKEKKENLLTDIHTTWFLLELEVASDLKDQWWLVKHAQSYMDYQSGESREVDLVASKYFYDKKTRFSVSVYLVIEVKFNKKHPPVVFTTDTLRPRWWSILNTWDNITTKERTIFSSSNLIEEKFPRYNQDRVGTAFHDAFKSSHDSSHLWKALISCSKAAYFLRDYCHKGNFYWTKFDKDFDPKAPKDLDFFLPIVIVGWDLFECFYREDTKEIDLKESSYIPCELAHAAKEYMTEGLSHPTFFPDVVAKSWLVEYLKNVDIWLTSVTSNLLEDLNKLLKDFES